MENFGDSMKKVILAGIGAVAKTTEKSKEVLDDLVKKGELTVEQGKTLRDEMKRNAEEKKIDKQIDGMAEVLRSMTPEQMAYLKEQIEQVEAEADEIAAEVETEEVVEETAERMFGDD